MGKRYKCPYCELRDERKKLIIHIDKRHEEMLPEGYDGARIMYDKINHTDGHGICRVCKKDTPWNPKAQRYDVLCGNPKCKEAMREEYKKNMLRVRGTYNILNDPEQQEKMLANRSISGKYKFKDGGVVTYTGSYEKKFLEFIDEFMEIASKDIMMPGPTLEYTYKGEKHFYITDCLYIPYNAIIEIKDGGDNPNNKSTPGMISSREKTIQKEKLITDRGEYNYIRLTNNDFTQLIEFFMEIKEKMLNDDPSMTIRIHESCVEESFAINEKDLYINFDKFESGKSNILLITGLSGSGKSTLAANLAKKYKCENFELDCLDFYLGGYLSKEKAKKYEPALYDFIEKKNLKQDKNLSSNELYKEYIKYIISWCKKHKDTKYIIEGLQIYEVYEDGDSFITSNPIIIKGTSALISSIRAAKRNEGPFLKEFKDLIKWAIKDSKSMKKLKNSIKEDYIEENLETILTTNPFKKEMTLYHGSYLKLDIITPMSYNVGTKLSGVRMSSFWSDQYFIAEEFAIYRLVNDMGKNYIIAFKPDLSGLIVPPSQYDSIIRDLKSKTIYIYEKTLPKEYIGIGHSNYFDEYTIDVPVKPDKVHVETYNQFKKFIKNNLDVFHTDDLDEIETIIKNNVTLMGKTVNGGIIRKMIVNDLDYFKRKVKGAKKLRK